MKEVCKRYKGLQWSLDLACFRKFEPQTIYMNTSMKLLRCIGKLVFCIKDMGRMKKVKQIYKEPKTIKEQVEYLKNKKKVVYNKCSEKDARV